MDEADGVLGSTNRVVVDVGETVVVALVDSDDEDEVDTVIKVEGTGELEVIYEAELLVELSEVAVGKAETEALADPVLGETRSMTT